LVFWYLHKIFRAEESGQCFWFFQSTFIFTQYGLVNIQKSSYFS
jgi:hypothetical protein